MEADREQSVQNLAERIAAANRAYHNGDNPLMSDDVYDRLKERLRKLDPAHPLLKEVGADVPKESRLAKRAHEWPMLSLNNAFEATDIAKFVEGVFEALAERGEKPPRMWMLEPKMDGFSIALVYRKGVLRRAVTRGNGTEGEDVTHAMLKARGVPLALSEAIDVQVDGEAVIHLDDFAKSCKDYSNTRNAAAGIARRLDGERANLLRFYAFRLRGIDVPPYVDDMPKNERAMVDTLHAWGFVTVPYDTIDVEEDDPKPADAIPRIIAKWKGTLKLKPTLPYVIDGLVLKVGSLVKQRALGASGGCPRSMVAMKWRGQMVAETVIRGIDNSVGRSGKITPVAVFDVVECGGTRPTRASMFNWDEVERMGTGLGARVLIERQGDVIPRVVEVLKPPKVTFKPPTECPVCAKPTERRGPELYCLNVECARRQFRVIMNWINQRNILEVGEAVIDKLMALDGPVQSIADLYRVDLDQLSDAASSHVVGRKLAMNIEKSKDLTLAELMGSVGVPGMMESEAGKIIRTLSLGTVEDFLAVTAEDLARVEGFKDKKTAKVLDGLAAMADGIRDLASLVRVKAEATGPLTGHSFCITGATEIPRDRLIAIIKAAGGVYKSSVTSQTEYLVMADPDSGSTKAREAAKKGTKCISESKLLDMAKFSG